MTRRAPSDSAAAPLRSGTRLSITVPSSGSFFEGHFPERPILPGVGLLDLALRALSAAGAPPTLREVAALRLRRPVAPADALALEVKAIDADGRLRLEVHRADEIVATGTILLGDPPPGPLPFALDRRPRPIDGLPDLDDLLPHRPPMRFVEGIEMPMDDGVVCAVRVPERCAFSAGGSAPALIALEMAAQSAAVFETLLRVREAADAPARAGYLVGAREVRFARGRVPDGRTLSAAVRLSGAAPPLSTYDFEVADGSEVVARGTLSTWLTATSV